MNSFDDVFRNSFFSSFTLSLSLALRSVRASRQEGARSQKQHLRRHASRPGQCAASLRRRGRRRQRRLGERGAGERKFEKKKREEKERETNRWHLNFFSLTSLLSLSLSLANTQQELASLCSPLPGVRLVNTLGPPVDRRLASRLTRQSTQPPFPSPAPAPV